MNAWNKAKKRRKLPWAGGNATSTDAGAAHVAQVQVADAAVQVDDDEYQEQLIQQRNTEVEVQAATAALKLIDDGFEAEDNLADSDYDSDYDDCEY